MSRSGVEGVGLRASEGVLPAHCGLWILPSDWLPAAGRKVGFELGD